MANWLNIIPTIPLTRGVPVIDRATKWRGVSSGTSEAARLVVTFDNIEGWVDADSTLVDLDDPQGFAYAHAWLTQNRKGPQPYDLTTTGMVVWRHMHGETTDADRVALAEDLAVIVAGR